MSAEWQLQVAKNRLSELVRRAQSDGPQTITVRGDRVAVLVSAEDFDALGPRRGQSLVEFFRASPLVGVELDLTRSRDAGRPIEL